jgi:hypothetical protein
MLLTSSFKTKQPVVFGSPCIESEQLFAEDLIYCQHGQLLDIGHLHRRRRGESMLSKSQRQRMEITILDTQAPRVKQRVTMPMPEAGDIAAICLLVFRSPP